MALLELDALERVRRRLDRLAEARLTGLTPDEEREYRELAKREADLLAAWRTATPRR